MPKEWTNTLRTHVWQYRGLSSKQRDRLDAWVRIFVYERNWEGCDGLALTDAMKVIVAGQAGITVLGHEEWFYDQTPTVLIYPNEYTAGMWLAPRRVDLHSSETKTDWEKRATGDRLFCRGQR